MSENAIASHLTAYQNVDEKKANLIAHKAQGNYNKALRLVKIKNDNQSFEEWFVIWVRAAFRAKGNASAINDLISWSEQIAGLGRETQKKFLHFCIEMFRQALLLNYQADKLVYWKHLSIISI